MAHTANRRPGYAQLLRTPRAWTFLIPGFLARQPFAMLTIGIVLLVEDTSGSYGTAGIVAAAAGLSIALIAPLCGKLADRYGQRAVLVPAVLLHAASVSLVIALALSDAPLWALLLAAVLAGASVPQIGPMVRARWAARLDPRSPLQHTAAAFESVTDEFTFVIGPVLAAALCSGVHPAAGLVAEAALSVSGGLLFAAQRRTQPPVSLRSEGASAGGSALRIPGVRVLAVSFLGIGIVFGGMQVSLTAFTEEIGKPGMNGVLYGVFAAGNMLAGLVVGMLHWRRPADRRLLLAYPVLVAATVPLWLGAMHPAGWLQGGLGLLVGFAIAPAMITGFTLVDALVPAGARTEAFTWLTGAVALGQALASSAAGQLADAGGARAGFLVPLGGTALACAVLWVLRGRLVPPVRPVEMVTGSGASRGARHGSSVSVD
ncbi:MFS transporter [Streptomyces boninensis]|uniref:MFS transporter n=1 Tax=Streptomyces boninensis TaxID=2039455 RepID=UPI003B21AD99